MFAVLYMFIYILSTTVIYILEKKKPAEAGLVVSVTR